MLKRLRASGCGCGWITGLVLTTPGLGAQGWQTVDVGTGEDLTSVAQSFGVDCWVTGTGGFQGFGCRLLGLHALRHRDRYG